MSNEILKTFLETLQVPGKTKLLKNEIKRLFLCSQEFSKNVHISYLTYILSLQKNFLRYFLNSA